MDHHILSEELANTEATNLLVLVMGGSSTGACTGSSIATLVFHNFKFEQEEEAQNDTR